MEREILVLEDGGQGALNRPKRYRGCAKPEAPPSHTGVKCVDGP